MKKTADTTKRKQPVAYSGTGSAVDNYFSPVPEAAPEEKNWEAFDFKNAKHRYILSMLHTMGWTKVLNGKTVGDMATFAHWLKTKSPVTKPLTEMTPKETSKAVYAFERVVNHVFS